MRGWKLDSYALAKTIVKGVQIVPNCQEQILDLFNYIAFPYATAAFLAVQQKQEKKSKSGTKLLFKSIPYSAHFLAFPCSFPNKRQYAFP